MNRITERNLLNIIKDFLLKAGFDEEQIQQEWSPSDGFRQRRIIDVVVMDATRDQSVPLATIEVKPQFSPNSPYANAIAQQCILSSDGISNPVHYFVATKNKEQKEPIFYLLEYISDRKITWKRIKDETELFSTIKSEPNSSRINYYNPRVAQGETMRKAQKTLDDFSPWMFRFACALAGLLLFDIVLELCGCTTRIFSYPRITVSAIIASLLIIPYAQSLNLLGIIKYKSK